MAVIYLPSNRNISCSWSLWIRLDLSFNYQIHQNSHKRRKKEAICKETLCSAGFQQRLR